jgi:BclB C-terminal domain-containing protein
LATLAGGAAGIPAYVGFGNSGLGLTVFGDTIDLTTTTGITNFAFVAPRDGTITEIAAQFLVTLAATISAGTVSIDASVFTAPAGSETFTLQSTLVLTPALSAITVGTIVSGALATSIPVTTGDNILLVFSATNSSAESIAGLITGYASAGITLN